VSSKRLELRDPAYQETKCVERGLVGPMHVLHDQSAWRLLLQLIEQRVHHLVALT
jgi:hypothetical protein